MTPHELDKLASRAAEGDSDGLVQFLCTAYRRYYEEAGLTQPSLDLVAIGAALDCVTRVAETKPQGGELWAEIERHRDKSFRYWLRQIQSDLQFAAEVQRMSYLPSPPELEGYELAALTSPLRPVGGDVYEFVRDGNGLLTAVIDGKGKGLSAAILASAAASVIRAVFPRVKGLNELLCELHRALHRPKIESVYVVCTLVYIGPDGQMTVACAGMDPPLLVRDGEVELLKADGPLIGRARTEKEPDIGADSFTVLTRVLMPGEIVAVYSDGITDRFVPSGELFGIERLGDCLASCRMLPLDQIAKRAFEALDRFSPSARREDDETLLLIRRVAA